MADAGGRSGSASGDPPLHARDGSLHTRDGLRLATRSWLPTADPRAAIVLVHGYPEHVGRYDRFARALTRAGHAVHGYDQRGHGSSQGRRANVRRFEELLDDLGEVVAWVTERQPDVPIVVLGHSMGGCVALRSVQTGRVDPDLLVLSSPFLVSAVAVPALLRRVLVALSEPFPELPTVSIDPRHVSRIPEEQEAYRLDPAIHHGPAKARIAAEMVRHGARALEEAPSVRQPTLVLHGTGDGIADPAGSRTLARSLPDATLSLFPDGAHELFNDHDRDEATATVLAWLDERLAASAAGKTG